MSDPPVIDGVLDDACWQGLPEYTGFTDSYTGGPISAQTIAKISYDTKNIYVAMRALDPNPSRIQGIQKKRNGNFNREDYVGVHIDSSHSHRGYSAFHVNAIGTQSESLESSASSKIEWCGDWYAAAKIVDDGYNVEMAIPFSVLIYNKGQDSFGLCFIRQIGVEEISSSWPNLNGAGDLRLYADWVGLKLPWTKPRPVAMAYVLGNAGDDGSGYVGRGLDIKYPFANDSLGVLSIKPDFSSIEQSVETIDFSYTERLLSDNRPFFLDWSPGLPAALFYSRQIPEFDVGARYAGKTGPNIYGFLNARDVGGRSDSVLHYAREIGSMSSIALGLTDHTGEGSRNRAAYFFGNLGWTKGLRRHYLAGSMFSSNDSSAPDGQIKDLQYLTYGEDGKISGDIYVGQVDAEFNNILGFVPVLDQRGGWCNVKLPKHYQQRNLQYSNYALSAWHWNHLDGSPFQSGMSARGSFEYNSGYSYSVAFSSGDWEQFHDSVVSTELGWNQNNRDKDGGMGFSWGRKAGGSHNNLSLRQNFKFGENLYVSGQFRRDFIGSSSPYAATRRQFISTLSYDLSTEKSVGARFVRQEGKSNIYFVYRQQVRRGMDAYFIYGDPNALETSRTLSLKLVMPLYR